MTPFSKTRRKVIHASLAVPLFLSAPFGQAIQGTGFIIPENVYRSVYAIYGSLADDIVGSDELKFVVPPIAEDGQSVHVQVSGAKGSVSSLAVFIDKSINPLVAKFKFEQGGDLPLRVRLKLSRTSDIYVIAETAQGLVAAKQNVKLTIGCGGG